MTINNDFPKTLQNRGKDPPATFYCLVIAPSHATAPKHAGWTPCTPLGVLPAVLELFRKIMIFSHFY